VSGTIEERVSIMIRRLLILVLVLGMTGLVAGAEPWEYFRIARLSYLTGHASFQHSGEVDWSAASINMALQPADRLYTGEDGRAEIEFDDGSVVYLAEKTDLEILSLKENLIQVRVLTGLLTLGAGGNVRFEINTPAAAFNTLHKGVYRFDVAENGDSYGIVRKGQLEAANNNVSRQIGAGEYICISAGEQGPSAVARYDQRDAWDEWTDRRAADRVVYDSGAYIPGTVYVGGRDLDRYGRWVVLDTYGPAWTPYYVDAGWSPYWEGRWWYRPFWGWTWISYEPWGWLPYHYGRWYHDLALGWCWLPEPSFGFHFWSPGLVRFYHGSNWVSWCPLGPGDYYNVNHYHYDRSFSHYLNNLRLTQRRGPDSLINRDVAGAFRTVGTERFLNERFGDRGRLEQTLDVGQPWKRGNMVADRLDVQPTARSYAPAPDKVAVAPPSRRGNLPADVRSTPATGSGFRDRVTGNGSDHGETQSSRAGTRAGRETPGDSENENRSFAGSTRSNSGAATGSARDRGAAIQDQPRSTAGRARADGPLLPAYGQGNDDARNSGRARSGSIDSGRARVSPPKVEAPRTAAPSPALRARESAAPRIAAPRSDNAPSLRMESQPSPPAYQRQDPARAPGSSAPSRPPANERPTAGAAISTSNDGLRSSGGSFDNRSGSSASVINPGSSPARQAYASPPASPSTSVRTGLSSSGGRTFPSDPAPVFRSGGLLSRPEASMGSAPRSSPSIGGSGTSRRRGN
jgi:hypothetical protein